MTPPTPRKDPEVVERRKPFTFAITGDYGTRCDLWFFVFKEFSQESKEAKQKGPLFMCQFCTIWERKFQMNMPVK